MVLETDLKVLNLPLMDIVKFPYANSIWVMGILWAPIRNNLSLYHQAEPEYQEKLHIAYRYVTYEVDITTLYSRP